MWIHTFNSGVNSEVNDLKLDNIGPILTLGSVMLSRIDKIAWVAQALLTI